MSNHNVYIVRSHRWLYAQLVSGAPAETCNLVQDPKDADLVIYPIPQWPDPDAPERLADLPPSVYRRLFLFSEADNPLLWAPGVFASVRRDRNGSGAFRGGFYLPEHHDDRYDGDDGLARLLVSAPAEDAEMLWSFVGTVSTCPDVRGVLMAVEDPRAIKRDTERWASVIRWERHGSRRQEAAESFRSYARSMSDAKFVVCPRGQGPASIRLFEAMQMARCPVIVSDQWLAPPFVDWSTCSIKIAEKDIARVPAILREREDDAVALGLAARQAWEDHFAPDRRLQTLVRACSDIEAGLGRRNSARRLRIAFDAAISYEAAWRAGNYLRSRARRVKAGLELARNAPDNA